ncbi:MAG: DUF4080 domain-containing protein [Bacilli bacterium]
MKTLLVGINSKFIHPAMGIMQLAANTTWPVLIREFTIKDDFHKVVEEIALVDADLIGISVYIWNACFVKEVLKLLHSKPIVVLGGPEVSFRPDEYFIFPNVKYIVKNEGELALTQLLDYYHNKCLLTEVSNLYYKTNEIHYTYDLIPDINHINHQYELMGDPKNRYVYLESSRGCPYSCSYCLASLDKKVRFFPLDQIKQEILWAINAHAKTIKFLDRTFNVENKRMIEILTFIKNHDNNHAVFQFEVVADLITDEVIAFLQQIRPGLIRFEIGIQSINEKTTAAINRKQDFLKTKDVVAKIKDNITIHLDLIAGLPYEDKASFQNTFSQTLLMFPDELQLGILKALAGTKIVKEKDLHDYDFNELPPYDIQNNKYLTQQDLQEIKLVEEGLNRYYNSHRFEKAMKYLLTEVKYNPYDLFLVLGTYLKDHPTAFLQIKDLASALFKAIQVPNQDYFLFLIKQDYLEKALLKPPIWWEYPLSKQEKNATNALFKKQYRELSLTDLSHNSRLEKYETKQEIQYFLVLYKPKNIFKLTIKKD